MGKQIFGETDGIRAKVGTSPLRPNVLKGLGVAIAEEMNLKKILTARDTRESGSWIKDCLAEGLKKKGVEIEDLGILPTPAIQKIIENTECDGGIMVTASHNPATDNGVKLFGADGDKTSDETELNIEKRFFEYELDADNEPEEREFVDLGVDAEYVKKYAQAASETLELAYNGEEDVPEDYIRGAGEFLMDSASGAGYSFSHVVFEDFGFEVKNIDPEPTGKNINDGFGALHPEKLGKECKQKGLMGIALDGDADRAILVDEYGRVWNGDRIVSMLALYLKEKGELKNDTVVLTEYSNLAAIKYLESKGIRVEKVVVGDRAVARKCKELGAILGGENAGHIIYLPWLNGSDGSFIALFARKIMQEKECALADLWPDYEEFPNMQLAVKVKEKRPLEKVNGWEAVKNRAEEVLDGRGRVFTRYSGTENKLRILVEGPDQREDETIAELLADVIRKEIGDED